MDRNMETIIRMVPQTNEVIVEQHQPNGCVSRKNIAPEDLMHCIYHSRKDSYVYHSGLLPDNCIGVSQSKNVRTYYLVCQDTTVPFTYQKTTYQNFPIPRLVFGFSYLPKEQKVVQSKVCIVGLGKLTADSTLYRYPFSNVGGSGRICLGNNTLPTYKHPGLLSTLPSYIMAMPNNNDSFLSENNRLSLEYRDLLEYLKDKSQETYYETVLKPTRETLGEFLERGYTE